MLELCDSVISVNYLPLLLVDSNHSFDQYIGDEHGGEQHVRYEQMLKELIGINFRLHPHICRVNCIMHHLDPTFSCHHHE